MNRIIISVTNDLSTDQRVYRTCDCLNEMGFEILLVGRQFKNSLPINKSYKTIRFRLFFNNGFLFYAEYNLRLFFLLLFLKKKDFLFANDLDTLLANFLISKMSSCKLIYDSHEYYTEVPELLSRPKVKSFWVYLEQCIFPKLKNVLTVNQQIAEIYTDKYAVPVTVVKNVPSLVQKNKPVSFKFIQNKNKKIILYQGALNLGRGLELIIDTMPFLRNYLLILAGDGDLTAQLKGRVKNHGLTDQVFFIGKLVPKELRYMTQNADLGVSLEEDMGLSYRYCLPNKVFDYIHGGIPILVSDLPLLKNLITDYKIGEILLEREPEKLAKQITEIISKKNDYTNGLNRAKSKFNWEIEKKTFIKFMQNIG